jgi:hypothetical protein
LFVGAVFVQEKVETIFNPAGFDTAELVKIASGVKHTPGEFAARFKADLAKKTVSASL